MLFSSRYLVPKTALFSLLYCSSTIAFAEVPTLPQTAKAQASESTENIEAKPESPGSFVSDGNPLSIEALGLIVSPPKGWEVVTNSGSLSLVMKEPRKEAPDYEKPKYQRNITLATKHESSPIDEKRAKELKEEMTKAFSADAQVSDFQVLEHRFFNYKGNNDGLLIYSSLNIGEFPMMQMHVLLSGTDKQFLLTYTDLADVFSDSKNGAFEMAWNSMVSTQVSGIAPNRTDEYIRYGAMGGTALALIGLCIFLRWRNGKHDFKAEADAFDDESPASASAEGSMVSTLISKWDIKFHKGKSSSSDSDHDDDFNFTTGGEVSLKSEKKYLSNF